MKAIKFVFAFSLGVFLYFTFSCAKLNEEEPSNICDETTETLINRQFVISAIVTDTSGEKYEGPLTVRIYKQYCEGGIPSDGDHWHYDQTNSDGYWSSGMVYGYKYENSLDRVKVVFYTDGGNYVVEKEEFYYEDVKDFPGGILSKTYTFTLD